MSVQGAKNGVTPLGNEYFRNAEEAQNKAAEWVGYIFHTPYSKKWHYREKFSRCTQKIKRLLKIAAFVGLYQY